MQCFVLKNMKPEASSKPVLPQDTADCIYSVRIKWTKTPTAHGTGASVPIQQVRMEYDHRRPRPELFTVDNRNTIDSYHPRQLAVLYITGTFAKP